MKALVRNLVFYLITVGLFIADIALAAFFGQPMANGLVAFTIDQSLRHVPPFRLVILLLMIGLQSFFWYGRFGIQLIVIAPITIMLIVFWHALRVTPALKYLILVITMLTQIMVVEHFMLKLALTPTCIFLRIVATLGIMITLSLK